MQFSIQKIRQTYLSEPRQSLIILAFQMEILLIRGYVRKPCRHSFSNVNRTIDEQQPIFRRECSLPIGSRGKINLRRYEKWRYFAVLSDLVFCFSIILKQE